MLVVGLVIYINFFVVFKYIFLKRENFLFKLKFEIWLNEFVSDIDVVLSCVYV